ncbi:hypothetical protein [Polynucleobacter parvulilacunae]|uniref:hypothetical protein n=1 Tax=Polynucleobacter parvulilacunae TaxID=1855631 RepID=UPI002104F9A4|nr:hypothetical protein [Polynucleobacter parvulilacunae]
MNQIIIRILSLMVFAAAMISCTSFPSINQDPAKNNQISYKKDLKECQEDYQETPSGTHIRQWINCMKLKGWN